MQNKIDMVLFPTEQVNSYGQRMPGFTAFCGFNSKHYALQKQSPGFWLHGREFTSHVPWIWFPALKNTNGGGVADRTEGGNVESETSNVQHHMSFIVH